MKPETSRYLIIVLFALAVVASGCTDTSTTNPEDDGDDSSPQQTDEASSGDSTDDSASNSGTAEISLKSLNVPEEVEMGEEFTVEATFENTGGESGAFTTTVMMREQDSETFSATDATIEGEIGASEEKTYQASLTANAVSANVIGLAGTNAESSLRIVPKRIGIGEEYTTSNSIGITVDSLEVVDYYTYEDYMGEETIHEPDSGKYVFANLKTQNKGDVPTSLPESYDFQLVANNRQYDTSTLYNEPINYGESYEGGEVQPGIIREGRIVFEVPEDVNREDVSIVWNELISLDEKSVYWTAENGGGSN